MNNYLIPANSKRSQLIFSMFTASDLILFGVGIGITLIMLLVLPIHEIVWAIMAITPGVIAAFLVIPVPNYHNILNVLKTMIRFYSSRQVFVWKGWDYKDGSN